MISVSIDDYLWFVDQALDDMVAIVTALGDEGANRRPTLAGANSPYQILTHCLGVMEFWGGSMIAGREITRDRDAEFQAAGSVADLVARVAVARERFGTDVAAANGLAPPRQDPMFPEDVGTPVASTQGGVLIHLVQELTQHLGQMEITRDLLRAGAD